MATRPPLGYGGWPFIGMALPELRNRQPGMMTLISLSISVAFVYSVTCWGSGADGSGLNRYGQILMRVRAQLRE